jgi:hypothetical protein
MNRYNVFYNSQLFRGSLELESTDGIYECNFMVREHKGAEGEKKKPILFQTFSCLDRLYMYSYL